MTATNQTIRKKTLGAFLRRWRIRAGLTQWDVASALGYETAQFTSNWERGVSVPPMDTIPTLVKLYGVSPKEMVKAFVDYEKKALEQYKRTLERKLGI